MGWVERGLVAMAGARRRIGGGGLGNDVVGRVLGGVCFPQERLMHVVWARVYCKMRAYSSKRLRRREYNLQPSADWAGGGGTGAMGPAPMQIGPKTLSSK